MYVDITDIRISWIIGPYGYLNTMDIGISYIFGSTIISSLIMNGIN